MKPSLRLILFSHQPSEREELLRRLMQDAFDLCLTVLDECDAVLRELASGNWDLVIGDAIAMKGQVCKLAGRLKGGNHSTAPFLIVCDEASEEAALAAMEAGAADCFRTDQLFRLVPAARRELESAAVRRRARAFELQLREVESRYSHLFDYAPLGIFQTTPEGQFIRANEAMARMLGYESAAEMMKCVTDIPRQLYVHPEERAVYIEQLRKEGFFKGAELQLYTRNRCKIWISSNASAVRSESGDLLFHEGILEDITDRKRVEALSAGQQHLLEMVAKGIPVSQVLDSIVRFIEQQSENALCSFLLVDAEGKHLRHGSAPSLPAEYVRAIDGVPIGPRAGSCGTAAYRAERVIVSDISADPLWEEFRQLALSHNLRACWSTPITGTAKKVLGTFAVYATEPREPSSYEVQAMDIAAHIAGIALEREDVEERLRSSEERFRLLFESVKDYAIYMLDPRGHVVSWNAGAQRLKGYSADEVIGQHFSRFFVEEDMAEGFPQKGLEKAAAEGRHEGECWHVRKDGSRFWANYVIAPVRDKQGQLQGFAKVSRDITEWDNSRKALRASEERWRTIYEYSPVGIALSDLSGQFVISNRAYQTMLGYSAEELLNKTFMDVTLAEDLRGNMVLFEELLSGKRESFEIEKRYRRKDGQVIWGRNAVALISSPDGNSRYAVAIVEDITVRKEAEDRLTYQAHLVSNVNDAIIATDENFIITVWNYAAERLFGYTAAEALGRSAREISAAHVTPRQWEEAMRELAERGEFQIESLHFRKDGEPIYVETRAIALRAEDGRVTGYVTVNRDITERKLAESERSHRAEQLQELAEASVRIHSAGSLEAVMKEVTERARKIIGSHMAVISVVMSQQGGRLAMTASLSEKYAKYRSFDAKPDRSGVYSVVMESNRPLRLNQEELLKHPAWRAFGPHSSEHPPLRGLLTVPLISRDGKNLGVIQLSDHYHGDFSEDDEAILMQLAQMASVAVENAWLLAQVRAGRERLEALSRRLMDVQESERRHLARELHDEIGQALTGLKLTLEMARRKATGHEQRNLHEAQRLTNDLMVRVRDLSLDLRPAMLDDLGLLPALLWQIERYSSQSGVQVKFEHSGLEGERFSPDIETAAYRIVQEALTNVARHSGAKTAVVNVWANSDELHLAIEDNGLGFELEERMRDATSSGLAGMRERANLLNGQLTIRSVAGAGTCLHAGLPLGAGTERRKKQRSA